VKETTARQDESLAATVQQRVNGMFKKILVPTDGSPLSDKAVDAAIKFAKKIKADIVAISVAEPLSFVVLTDGAVTIDLEAYEKKACEQAQQHVQRVENAARTANVRCETVTALSFNPYEEIINAANAHHCDIIFMASHGRKGLNRLLVGSETQKVLTHSTIPVLVFR
jgi:nucleotide-binding universal stress UspA family protein